MNKPKKNLGERGIVYRRGMYIVLENEGTGEHRAVKVILHDSRQGWLAESKDGDMFRII